MSGWESAYFCLEILENDISTEKSIVTILLAHRKDKTRDRAGCILRVGPHMQEDYLQPLGSMMNCFCSTGMEKNIWVLTFLARGQEF